MAISTAIGVAEQKHERRRSLLWAGLAITVLGAASNFLYFVSIAGQGLLPWINLLVPAIGLLIVALALWRAFAQPQTYGGKLLGSIFVILCVPLAGISGWGFFHARDMPSSSGAPRIGQRAPDFTLVSATGESVSLSQMLSRRPDDPAAPKAVMLIFYRGYW